jgi:hypothetical protein
LPSSTCSATRKKNPAIVLYQADEFIEFLLRHSMRFIAAEFRCR